MTSGVSSCLPSSSSRLSLVTVTALHTPGPWASDPFSCFCCTLSWRMPGLQMLVHLHCFNLCSRTKSGHQAFPVALSPYWVMPLVQHVYFKENYSIWEIENLVERKRNQDDSWCYGRGMVWVTAASTEMQERGMRKNLKLLFGHMHFEIHNEQCLP